MLNAESERSSIQLPRPPAGEAAAGVAAWYQPVRIDTYLPEAPDPYPAFLERRVYQGSSGRVFPLPFHERIAAAKTPHRWQAWHLENRWLRLVMLPELGGRIHIAWDKAAGYDIFYRNNVIKPALVGLAGPWIAGGVEFNWPQHHRPATFLPTQTAIERDDDGSVTIWFSDHDPFERMKGMHGVRLRPDSAVIELRVRLYNRSEIRQTFLWWANVAAAVNDDYQSFFPPDVRRVADHARRADVSFPRPDHPYYGIDYAARADAATPDGDRLDWYRNIPVPTSYMVVGTREEFFGGYDHGAGAGFVHWAARHISPGKKQWTWGNAPFGDAWTANLTDADGPYVELMAGVYTDNQPDFAYLDPGETKSFSQYWYPVQRIGPAHAATRDAAASLTVTDGVAALGICVSRPVPGATARLLDRDGAVLWDRAADLEPCDPLIAAHPVGGRAPHELELRLEAEGRMLVAVRHPDPVELATRPVPPGATEPPDPADVATIDELVHIARYLEQYRHATRSAEPYWVEALRRDPVEARAAEGLGARRYATAEYDEAVRLFRAAVARTTAWAPTPYDGGAYYRLGLALARAGDATAAEEALARAAWDAGHATAARYALARLHARDGRTREALDLLRHVHAADPQHLQAAALLAALVRRAGRPEEADRVLAATLDRDPLDAWARDLAGHDAGTDPTILLDVALEYAGAGLVDDALATLDRAGTLPTPVGQVTLEPLLLCHRAYLLSRAGRADEAAAALHAVPGADTRLAHPSRLDDVDALRYATDANPADPVAPALLGHWMYDARRYRDAIELWRESLRRGPDPRLLPIVARNLGLAAYNVDHDGAAARRHYLRALDAAPDDAKLWYEYDQLAERLGDAPAARLDRLAGRVDIVERRDDLIVSFARLLTAVGDAARARELLAGRTFQPWEGGEGQVLAAWDGTTVALARQALDTGDPGRAVELVATSLDPPPNLGEQRHPLATTAELHLVAGDAHAARGDVAAATDAWERSAAAVADFTKMATTPYGTQTVHAIVALRRLGRHDAATRLTRDLATWVDREAANPARIDYFATSLPTMLLFLDDPAVERDRRVALIRTQLADLAATAGPAPAAP